MMPEVELLVKKAETLPPQFLAEALDFIDYLSLKAEKNAGNKGYIAKKLQEAELEASKSDAVWLDEEEFWDDALK
jgi:hypothetical protein